MEQHFARRYLILLLSTAAGSGTPARRGAGASEYEAIEFSDTSGAVAGCHRFWALLTSDALTAVSIRKLTPSGRRRHRSSKWHLQEGTIYFIQYERRRWLASASDPKLTLPKPQLSTRLRR